MLEMHGLLRIGHLQLVEDVIAGFFMSSEFADCDHAIGDDEWY